MKNFFTEGSNLGTHFLLPFVNIHISFLLLQFLVSFEFQVQLLNFPIFLFKLILQLINSLRI